MTDESKSRVRQPLGSGILIRPPGPLDLAAVDAIQQSSPEAAHWNVADYLDQEIYVAVIDNLIGGFVVLRTVAPGEREILNLAVTPALRRRGVASALLEGCLRGVKGSVFLEVRESNHAAREFYKLHRFQEVSRRPKYYDLPSETAIVMKFHSC